MPKVSVLTPSYNHERFIDAFIGSVLAQTDSDWELVIVDDFSTDGNVEKIRRFNDSRIKLVCHDRNRGINAALMTAFENSTAPIITLIASDDLLIPDCVSRISRAFEDKSIDVLASKLVYVDENGRRRKHQPEDLDDTMSLHDRFLSLALSANQWPSPGLSMRREVFASILPLDLSFLQIQDWQINMLLAYSRRVKLSNDPIVYYRTGDFSHIDNGSGPAEFRKNVEIFRMMEKELSLVKGNVDAFKAAFGTCDEISGMKVEADTIPFLLGVLAAKSNNLRFRPWGLLKIHESISDENGAQRIYELYGFSFKDYIKLSNVAAEGYLDPESANWRIEKLERSVGKRMQIIVWLGIVAVLAMMTSLVSLLI